MKRAVYVIGLVSAVAVLAAVAFAAADRVADVAILPMPEAPASGGATAEGAPGEQGGVPNDGDGVSGGAALSDAPTGDDAAPADDGGAGGAGVDRVAGDGVGADPMGPDGAAPWTEEEIDALRELARERIAARKLGQDLYNRLQRVWEERVRPWFEALEAEGGDEPSAETLRERIDEWLTRTGLTGSEARCDRDEGGHAGREASGRPADGPVASSGQAGERGEGGLAGGASDQRDGARPELPGQSGERALDGSMPQDALGALWDEVVARLAERTGVTVEELIDRAAEQTGLAVEDLREIGRAWLEGQRELFEALLEDIQELQHELQSSWTEPADESGTGPAAGA